MYMYMSFNVNAHIYTYGTWYIVLKLNESWKESRARRSTSIIRVICSPIRPDKARYGLIWPVHVLGCTAWTHLDLHQRQTGCGALCSPRPPTLQAPCNRHVRSHAGCVTVGHLATGDGLLGNQSIGCRQAAIRQDETPDCRLEPRLRPFHSLFRSLPLSSAFHHPHSKTCCRASRAFSAITSTCQRPRLRSLHACSRPCSAAISNPFHIPACEADTFLDCETSGGVAMSSPYPDKTPGTAVQYAYMFEKDKGPTKQFDALLRAIARYVVRNSLFYVAQDESWCHGTVIGRGHMEKIDVGQET